MLDIQEAAAKAREAFLALHPDVRVEEVHLAEVELTDGDRLWSVTISYHDDEVSGIGKAKVLGLDAETGQVRSVRIRTL
jgi:hypothetical protein